MTRVDKRVMKKSVELLVSDLPLGGGQVFPSGYTPGLARANADVL